MFLHSLFKSEESKAFLALAYIPNYEVATAYKAALPTSGWIEIAGRRPAMVVELKYNQSAVIMLL